MDETPTGICRSWPHCRRPATSGRFCDEHAAILHRVRNEIKKQSKAANPEALEAHNLTIRHITPKPAERSKPKREPKPPGAPSKMVRDRAIAWATFVRETKQPTSKTEAAAKLNIAPRTLGRSVKIAQDEGWTIAKRGPGGGYMAGPVQPPGVEKAAATVLPLKAEALALPLARLLQGSDAPIRAPEAAKLLDCSTSTVKRAARLARAEGWLVSKTGPGGGYVIGPTELPAEPIETVAA